MTISIFSAIHNGDITVIEELIRHNPSLLQAVDENGLSIVSAAIYHHQEETARVLIQAGAPVTFFEHCALGNTSEVKKALDNDSTLLNQFSPDGFQPLGLASFFGQTDVAELLIHLAAELNTPSKTTMKVMPLHSAVAGKHMRISELLLEAGADVNAVQQHGYTPLHEASASGQLEIVQLLECFGADRTLRLDDGRTPLDLAVENGFTAVAALLEQ